MVEDGASEVDRFARDRRERAGVRSKAGDALRAGSLILGHAVTVRATARAQDSLVAEIARLLEAGQQNRNRYVRLADRAAALYVPLVHGAAVGRASPAAARSASTSRTALTNAIALLIITCPCALGLAVPAVQIVATSRLFRRGLLVKSGDALERLAEADTVVFDKTGTLTFGAPVLTNAASSSQRRCWSTRRRLRAPASIRWRARLAAAAGPGAVRERTCARRRAKASKARVDGRACAPWPRRWVGAATATGDREPLWYREGDQCVRFDFEDELRADAAADRRRRFSDRGLEVEMLSGDRELPASLVALQCGIERLAAATDPKAKVRASGDVAREGRRDVDDRRRLERCRGAGASRMFRSRRPRRPTPARRRPTWCFNATTLAPIVEAIDVARAARRRVFQNFAFAALYNAARRAAGRVRPGDAADRGGRDVGVVA